MALSCLYLAELSGGVTMLRLWAIFNDDPGAPKFTRVEITESMRQGRPIEDAFANAVMAGEIDGHPLKFLWTTGGPDVVGGQAFRWLEHRRPDRNARLR
jgi:hypothetical protein